MQPPGMMSNAIDSNGESRLCIVTCARYYCAMKTSYSKDHGSEITSEKNLMFAVVFFQDGTCTVHSVRKGNYVRTILPFSNNPESFTVPSVAMSDEGKIVLYARTKKDAGEVY